MFKFEIGQKIYYRENNRLRVGIVRSRLMMESDLPRYMKQTPPISPKWPIKKQLPLGLDREMYHTNMGALLTAEEAYGSREDYNNAYRL